MSTPGSYTSERVYNWLTLSQGAACDPGCRVAWGLDGSPQALLWVRSLPSGPGRDRARRTVAARRARANAHRRRKIALFSAPGAVAAGRDAGRLPADRPDAGPGSPA